MIKVGLIPNKIFTLACQSSVRVPYHDFLILSDLSEVFLEFFYNIPFPSKSSKKKPILKGKTWLPIWILGISKTVSQTLNDSLEMVSSVKVHPIRLSVKTNACQGSQHQRCSVTKSMLQSLKFSKCHNCVTSSLQNDDDATS